MGLGPVDEEEFFRGAGKGGIEPVDVVGGEHIVCHISLIEIDMGPLTTLGFMTCNCIGKLDLKVVVVTVALQFLDEVCLIGYVGIILQNGIEELLLLVMSQSGSLRCKGIKDDDGSQFIVIVVGKQHRHLSETEAKEFMDIPDTLNDGNVAIGNKWDFLGALCPEIVVLHNHQLVASA